MYGRSVLWSAGGMQVCLDLLLLLHGAEGCSLSDNPKQVIAYTGGSVFLPCSCRDQDASVQSFSWINLSDWRPIEIGLNRTRFQLFNTQSLGNVSLLISNLTKEDTGYYRCKISSSSNEVFSDILLSVKGCSLQTGHVSVQGDVGESVVLPCSCAEPQAKPETLKWLSLKSGHKEIYPNAEINRFTGRVQLVKSLSPGNLSLLISTLTVEDDGWYRCEVNGRNKDIKVTVTKHRISKTTPEPDGTASLNDDEEIPDKASTDTPSNTMTHFHIIIISAAVGVLLLLLVVGGIILWRYKAQGRRDSKGQTGQKKQQDTQNCHDSLYSEVKSKPTADAKHKEDDVTYSTILHNKPANPAHVPVASEEMTEYARIKRN